LDENNLASGAEEVGEERAALFGEKAGGDFDFVVELGMVHDGEDGAAGSGFGVGCGVNEASNARVENGSGAHGAGFECGVEGAVFESIVAEVKARFAEGDDLGVGGGVGVAEDSVLAAADDLVFADYNCADGDFAAGFGGFGFGYGDAEKQVVARDCEIGEHGASVRECVSAAVAAVRQAQSCGG
jgi:hypothetical protein